MTSSSSCSSSWRTTRSLRSREQIGSTCITGGGKCNKHSQVSVVPCVVSHVSVVFVLCVLPRVPESNKKVSVFFS